MSPASGCQDSTRCIQAGNSGSGTTAPPAAILCDHRMAGMSGTEFHDEVSRIAPDLAPRFAFMSGDVLNPELQSFAQARGVHLLAKPFDLATVEAIVSTLLAAPPAGA